MKIGAILLFLISIYGLIQLVLGNSFLAGKVIVNPSIQAIVMQTLAVIVLGYLSLKLKWEE